MLIDFLGFSSHNIHTQTSTSPCSTSTRSLRRTTIPSSATSSSLSTSRSRSRPSRRSLTSSPSSTVLAVTALAVSFCFFCPRFVWFIFIFWQWLPADLEYMRFDADPTCAFNMSLCIVYLWDQKLLESSSH